MKLSQFNFPLTIEQIAKYPAKFRDESRMMVLHKDTGEIEHKQFKDIVLELAQRNGLEVPEETILAEANKWELRHGGVSGRTAQQFINYMTGTFAEQ